MQALGLIVDQAWTKAAELVFWRLQPDVWTMNFESDTRFVAAVSRACDTIPADMRTMFEGLAVVSDEWARQTVFRQQVYDLDWQFNRRWRLADGWLSQEAAFRALGISYDNLAIAMRQAVMAQLYPSIGFLAEG